MTRVFVLASTPMIRAGLRAMLEESGVTVAENDPGLPGPEAEVVLAAGEDLIEDAAELLSGDGTRSLLVLAEDDRPVSVLRELPLHGWGVVAPDAPPEEIAAAAAAVGEGLVVLPKNLTERVLQSPAIAEDLDEPLTPRESEVLELLGRGLSNKLIAGELHISGHTVKFHVSSLYAKLGVSSRAEAVSQAARHGLISL
ncbi:MAG: response regulator transcription factor [Rubrobacteraceae bacterium]